MAYQKTYTYERFLTTALQDLFPTDPNTMRYASERTKRLNRSIQRRASYATKCSTIVANDVIAQNRGLGLHDSSPRIVISDQGIMSGLQLIESNGSLKTCTLYPFKNESLIRNPEHLENFYKVIAKDHLKKKTVTAHTASTSLSVFENCNCCALTVDSVDFYKCSSCCHCLHVDCVPHNWNMSTDDDGFDLYVCYDCFLASIETP